MSTPSTNVNRFFNPEGFSCRQEDPIEDPKCLIIKQATQQQLACHMNFIAQEPLRGTISITSNDSLEVKSSTASRVDDSAQTIVMQQRKHLVKMVQTLVNYRDKTSSELLSYTEMEEKNALEWIETMSTEMQQSLLQQTFNYFLLNCDLRILAVLKGHFKILEWAVKNSSIELCGTQGWNLAHFAMLHPEGKNKLQQLEQLGISLDQKNDWGSTPIDFIDAITGLTPTEVDPFGSGQSISQEEYKQQVGSIYMECAQFTPYALLAMLLGDYKPEEPDPFLQHISDQYPDYLENRKNAICKVKIRKMEGESVAPNMQGQWECVARSQIKKGELFIVYTGMFQSGRYGFDQVNRKSDKDFYIDPFKMPDIVLDASVGGSMAEFINHGFPNCNFCTFYHKGLPVVGLVALESIQPGEIIYAEYSNLFKKFNFIPMVLNEGGLNKYLEETKCLTYFPNLIVRGGQVYGSLNEATLLNTIEEGREIEVMIEACSSMTKLLYITQQPGLLERLLEEKKISQVAFDHIKTKFTPYF